MKFRIYSQSSSHCFHWIPNKHTNLDYLVIISANLFFFPFSILIRSILFCSVLFCLTNHIRTYIYMHIHILFHCLSGVCRTAFARLFRCLSLSSNQFIFNSVLYLISFRSCLGFSKSLDNFILHYSISRIFFSSLL